MMKSVLRAVGFAVVVLIAGCIPLENDETGGSSGDGGGSGSGGSGTTPSITIRNSTGFSIGSVHIKPSTSTNWGSNLLGWSLSDGESRTFALSQPLSTKNVYDIRLTGSGGSDFRRYMVTITNNMTITFTANNLDNGSDLPSITVQNRSGVAFNSIHIKPSISSDWGTNFGSISNNSDLTVTIPIPPSSYTVFDIQLRSSNPANTYTRNNVTVSDSMVLTYTSADSDNPLIGLPVIVIQNNTGFSIGSVHIKPSTSTDWGFSLLGWSLSDGESRTFALSQPLSTQNVYDIRLSHGGGNNFIKYMVTVSEGMIVTFSINDLEQ